MILAGHPTSHVPCLLSEVNISRLPLHIAKQLAGTLPSRRHADQAASGDLDDKKSSLSESSQGYKLSRMIPMGIVLVEICGTHDLYWVRLEAVSPFQVTNVLDIDEKRRTESCIIEAVQTVQWMHDEAKSTLPVQDIDAFADNVPPTAEELEASIIPKTGKKGAESKAKAVDKAAKSATPKESKTTLAKESKAAAASAIDSKAAPAAPHEAISFVYETPAGAESIGKDSKRGRAILNTRAMLTWIDSFRHRPESTSGTKGTPPTVSKGSFKGAVKHHEEHAAKTGNKSGGNAKGTGKGKKGVHGADAAAHKKADVHTPSSTPSKKRPRESSGSGSNKRKDSLSDHDLDEFDDGAAHAVDVSPSLQGRKHEPEVAYAVLYGGCTKHVSGVGPLTIREVDTSARLFFLENPRRDIRKTLLRQELQNLQKSIEELHELSERRQQLNEEF
jgi:hypothetical protein